jgi:hypothetical protein
MLVIKVLTTSEIEYSSGECINELIEHLGDLDNKDSIHKKVNKTFESCEFDFPTVKSLLDSYKDSKFNIVLLNKSEWIDENHPYKDFTDMAKDDSCYWNRILCDWALSYNQGEGDIGEIQLSPSSFKWADLSMIPVVNTYLDEITKGEDKVIIDISSSNPLALHFFHWGMKTLEKGMNVEFIQQVMDKDGRLEVVSQFI